MKNGALKQDQIETEEVIIIGNLFAETSKDFFMEHCFNKSNIHLFGRECIGKGACLRANEIKQLFGSGICVEQDLKIKY